MAASLRTPSSRVRAWTAITLTAHAGARLSSQQIVAHYTPDVRRSRSFFGPNGIPKRIGVVIKLFQVAGNPGAAADCLHGGGLGARTLVARTGLPVPADFGLHGMVN